jgi:hypothetical protein
MMTAHGAYSLDASLPAYRAVDALSGHLKSVGSDTLGHETEAWAKGFEMLYPDVKVDIEAVGSATAPTALVEGRAQKEDRSLARTCSVRRLQAGRVVFFAMRRRPWVTCRGLNALLTGCSGESSATRLKREDGLAKRLKRAPGTDAPVLPNVSAMP